MDHQTETVDIDQAAELLGVTVWTVYNWVRKGLLSPATSGGKLIFDRNAVVEFKQRQPRRGRPRCKNAPEKPIESPQTAIIAPDEKKSLPSWALPKSKPTTTDEFDEEEL